MFKSDSQSKDIFKISFNIQYKDINIFEEFFTEKVSAISVYEVKSKTLESQPKDIWCFEIYCDNQTNLVSLKKEVQELAKLNNIEITSDIISEEIENKDWVALYQNQLAPIQTNRFFICTTLHQDKCPKDKTLILIEASRAFGTGTHETTSGCIEALEYLKAIKANKILDIANATRIIPYNNVR